MEKNKFKVWDKIRGQWIRAFKIVLAPGGEVMAIEDLSGELYGMHQVDLVQCSGLEVNSVEIYEGDVIKADNGSKFRVVFFDGSFQVARLQERIKIVMSLSVPCRNRDIVIIGNIYENQELMERS